MNTSQQTRTETTAAVSLDRAAYERDRGDDAASLDALRGAAFFVARAIEDQVRKMRADGASWSTIGTALGMSRQAAQQRYRGIAEHLAAAQATAER